MFACITTTTTKTVIFYVRFFEVLFSKMIKNCFIVTT